jgi:hypothetical protein
MPNDNSKRRRREEEEEQDPTPEDLSGALEQLDRAAARVRQLVYRIRPMLRDGEEKYEKGDVNEDRRPVRGAFRRRNA